ncbi:hypothetical protein FVE85_2684 [Porphyridium purpureum]|uniref:Nucleotide-diphospho-sugar transferase domain-containing protein n=1 Tax=Porphyridium purpureum TaxID=35688 RepID=A0A5J4YUK3_PORPP|nr:hypothetical protein FVE85_2684 [Porphyridium purpureum]|eukprot:POR0223..scf227_4
MEPYGGMPQPYRPPRGVSQQTAFQRAGGAPLTTEAWGAPAAALGPQLAAYPNAPYESSAHASGTAMYAAAPAAYANGNGYTNGYQRYYSQQPDTYSPHAYAAAGKSLPSALQPQTWKNWLRLKLRGLGVKNHHQHVVALVVCLFFLVLLLLALKSLPSLTSLTYEEQARQAFELHESIQDASMGTESNSDLPKQASTTNEDAANIRAAARETPSPDRPSEPQSRSEAEGLDRPFAPPVKPGAQEQMQERRQVTAEIEAKQPPVRLASWDRNRHANAEDERIRGENLARDAPGSEPRVPSEEGVHALSIEGKASPRDILKHLANQPFSNGEDSTERAAARNPSVGTSSTAGLNQRVIDSLRADGANNAWQKDGAAMDTVSRANPGSSLLTNAEDSGAVQRPAAGKDASSEDPFKYLAKSQSNVGSSDDSQPEDAVPSLASSSFSGFSGFLGQSGTQSNSTSDVTGASSSAGVGTSAGTGAANSLDNPALRPDVAPVVNSAGSSTFADANRRADSPDVEDGGRDSFATGGDLSASPSRHESSNSGSVGVGFSRPGASDSDGRHRSPLGGLRARSDQAPDRLASAHALTQLLSHGQAQGREPVEAKSFQRPSSLSDIMTGHRGQAQVVGSTAQVDVRATPGDFLVFEPTNHFDVNLLISQMHEVGEYTGFLPRGSAPMGVVTYIVAPNAGVARQMEAITTFTRIQAIGIPGIHEPWKVPITLFTTAKTMEHLAAHWSRDPPHSMSWPFDKVVLLDHTQLVETVEQYSLPSCCSTGCCKHPNAGTKRDKWAMKIAAIRQSPYDVTLYVDSDIYACDAQGMAEHVRSVLDGSFDLRITDDKQNGGGDLGADITANGTTIPVKFFERNTGLIVYNKHVPAMRELLDKYSRFYLEQLVHNPTIKHDQPAFRRALYEQFDGIKYKEIPRTEHCRGTWMYRVDDDSALKSLDCIYAHGDNRTRPERLVEFPCRGDPLDKYIPLIGRIAQNGLTWK